jgi:subtilisin family serine protease
MPDEEEQEEQGRTHEPLEQPQGEAARDEAGGEARSLTESERPAQPEETPPSPAASSAEGGRNVMPTVSSRKEQFLIAKKSGPLSQEVQPVDLSGLEQALKAGAIAGAAHVRTLTRRGRVAVEALRVGAAGAETIIVAEMPPQVADQLRQHPGLVVEPDQPLVYTQPTLPVPVGRDPGVVVPYGTGFTVSLSILGDGGSPLEGAEVYLYGRWWPVQGVTDAHGRVQLTLFGESPNAMRALYVKPKADYWSLWITQPALDPAQENTVFLTPLTQMFPNFPQQQLLGWGQKVMKVDQLPPHYRGQGVKVAVIDSGIATSHRDLQQQVKGGYDTLTQNDTTWAQDTLAHGTHTAGVIAGNLDNAIGIRGIAPDAEIYAYKIFPDGRFSNLIGALNLCIEQQIDVVNLSLGSEQRSELVEQKIQEAKRLGVACIVAAGNSGGPVQYPATSPHVLAVAAIGKQGEFPPESYHGTQVLAGNGRVGSSDGFFSARFTCFGPEVGVCAPGVAILSSVPPDNFAVLDGTSMAAPHVTGLAALVLAHHADFQGAYKARNAPRVERLLQILKQSAQPLNLGDPYRVGAGLPDALQALSLAPPAATGMPASIDELVRQVLEMLRRGTTPIGVGELATSGAGATLQDLKAVMRQAGLLAGNGGAAPQRAPASGTPVATLQDLKAVMGHVGLLARGGGAVALTSGGPNGGQTTLRELKATLQQVGLL